MQSKLIEAPVLEPFTLDEIKQALRVTHDLQDTLIWTLATSARKMCEDAARMAISPQRWLTVYRAPQRRGDEFGLLNDVADPERILTRLVLPRPPTVEVIRVTLVYRDGRDHVDLVRDVDWYFDPHWGAITWSDVGQRQLTHPFYPVLEVEYAAGFPLLHPVAIGDPLPAQDKTVRQVDVQDDIREAIYVTAAQGYDDPDATMSTIPNRALQLLRPYWNAPRYAG